MASPIPGIPHTSLFSPSTPPSPPKPSHHPIPPRPPPTPPSFPKRTLLTLPPELRQHIYSFLLPTSTIGHEHAVTQPAHASDLRFLLACRQLHAEGLSHYFERNNLLLKPARAGLAFLRGIGPQRRAQLAEITLELAACHLTVGCMEMLALCTGLRSLSLSMAVEVVRDLLGMGKWAAVHGFGAAEIYETVHEGCGVEHLDCREDQARSLVYDSTLGQPWVIVPREENAKTADLRAVVLLLTAPCEEGCTYHGGRRRLVDRRASAVSISDLLWWR
ncbi:MAG: hypothetical protein M1829_006028 [Trizodia sp. TS-e1964]|nr:MAG: hypothetical protein M1829_006028 [Trizodia sp. TS-e1964]